MSRKISGFLRLMLAGAALSPTAWASCGSAFCAVNTGAAANSLWSQPGTRIDLRYEYLKQDELRSGSSRVGLSGEPGEEDELKTLNRNWRLAVDHTFDAHWGISVVLPYVHRDHEHLLNPPEGLDETPELESWRMREAGDAQVVGRYEFGMDEGSGRADGVQFGLKLPTGRYQVRNSAGELADRSLQPGSGTTDLIVGAYHRAPLLGQGDWFVSATVDMPLASRADFRPGTRLGVDVGASYPFGSAFRGHLQLNLVERWRDSGVQAQADDSGGTFAYLSPGLSLVLDQRWTVYAFLQAPLYQYVNGRQLTSGTGGIVGASISF